MANRNRGHTKDRRTIAGRKARQGEIVLNTTSMRVIFIAGFLGVLALAFIMQWYA